MSFVSKISEDDLANLRESVKQHMRDGRFTHTLGVEREIAALGALYLPQDLMRLRAAALLHDLTKERSYEEQLTLCARGDVHLDEEERRSPKILHALSAPIVIEEEYPQLADPAILTAIRQHTTGDEKMPLFSKLLYLADYIEEGRTFSDCQRLRYMFWDGIADLPQNKYEEHLNRVLLTSFEMTISSLVEEGAPIAPKTVAARDALVAEISNYK